MVAHSYCEITDKPINSNFLYDQIVNNSHGAIVEFKGLVRNHDAGKPVSRLEYEAHDTALAIIQEISLNISKKYPEVSFAISHRYGSLEIGELAFYVITGAAHRAQAFEVSRLIVEEVKEKIPVWKNQVYEDGTNEWVNSA